jgi:hypothetical protein
MTDILQPAKQEPGNVTLHVKEALMEWPFLIEKIRTEHNGVFAVNLFFGHDGHNVCWFKDYDRQLAKGESGRSMQEAVERCIAEWQLERQAAQFAKDPTLA